MDRKNTRGLGGILHRDFIELDELPAPAANVRAVRVAIRNAIEETRRHPAESFSGNTNSSAQAGVVGGSSVSGENLVDIEPNNLAAEVAAVEIPEQAGAPPAPAAAPGESIATAAAELTMEQLQANVPAWKPGTDLIANTLADVVAPNWRITREEREQVSGAFALALSAWFPDDVIPIKYLVLMNVGASLWNLAASRRDPNTGKFIPLRLAPAADAAKTAEPPAAPAAGAANASTSSGATTSV